MQGSTLSPESAPTAFAMLTSVPGVAPPLALAVLLALVMLSALAMARFVAVPAVLPRFSCSPRASKTVQCSVWEFSSASGSDLAATFGK